MSRSFSQAPTLRRLALALSVPAALAACQGATDALAPDAADAEAAPAPSPGLGALLGSNRIAYALNVAGGDSDIWTMGPTGGSLTRHTSFSGQEHSPTWSPDRKRLVFARQRNVMLDIYLLNADGTKRWVRSTASNFPIYRPSWSPNGSHLLVTVYQPGGPFVAKLDIATGNATLVAPAGSLAVKGDFPIYDATGSRIYYIDDSRRTIKRFTPGGAQEHILTYTATLAGLAISPDGTKLAYAAALMENNWEIFVLDLTTRLVARLTNSAGTDASPTWSPDGTKLAFYSARSGKSQIWTMSSTGGSQTRITNATYGAFSPAWAR